MKKILIATTALVASTSFAMADVDLSGSAEMGVFGGSDIEDQFHSDINVIFTMSGETDGGLTFGAAVDLDGMDGAGNTFNDGAYNPALGGSDTSIFVSGTYGTLTMGDTDGALDFVLSEAIIGSSIQDDHEHAGYNGNNGLDGSIDGQVARYDYTVGGFSFAASLETENAATNNTNTVYGIGVRYEGDFGGTTYGVGLGYQAADVTVGGDPEALGLSLNVATAGGLTGIVSYIDYDNATVGGATGVKGLTSTTNFAVDDHIGVAVGYTFGQLLVAANYGVWDGPAGDISGYGLVANYDLGGGARLLAGYGHNDLDSVTPGLDNDNDTYSFGISMAF